MSAPSPHAPRASSPESEVRALYERLIAAWNARDSDTFAAQFADDGESIGFDGSQLSGSTGIAAALRAIFADHPTGRYIPKIRWVRPLSPDVALLRAVVGMVPSGHTDLEPRLNAVQSVVALQRDGQWRIVQLQNTPAQYHGRPDLSQQLTDELRQLL